MTGFTRFLDGLLDGKIDKCREEAITTTIGNITIDTCYTFDCGYETGVDKGNGFIIVEEYDSKESASIGHKKWVELIKKYPDMELKECRTSEEWFFGNI